MSRHAETLCSILGTETLPDASEYPETLTLPEGLHEIMVQAVVKTAGDRRERSVRIGYRDGEWVGGVMMRGTAYNKHYEARSNLLHNIGCMAIPPQIHLHTHPPHLKTELDDWILPALDRHDARCAQKGQKLTPEDREKYYNDMTVIYEAQERIPSANDVQSCLESRPLGTVGAIVASGMGSFVSLRRSVHPRNPFNPHPEENSARRLLMAQSAYAWLTKNDAGRKLNVDDPASLDNHITYLETSRAKALDPLYVSYFSTDIFSPELRQVPLVGTEG